MKSIIAPTARRHYTIDCLEKGLLFNQPEIPCNAGNTTKHNMIVHGDLDGTHVFKTRLNELGSQETFS